MITRTIRLATKLSTKYPGTLLIISLFLTLIAALHISSLKLNSSLTDLIHFDSKELQLIETYIRNVGYGNYLYAIIESKIEPDDTWETLENFSDRLTMIMMESGKFRYVRNSINEDELLDF